MLVANSPKMTDLINQPWPWYIAGPLLGLLVPFVFFFLNKDFGISSTMKDICAMCLPGTKIKFFNYNWKESLWNVVFALGVIMGALLVHTFIPNAGDVAISEGTTQRLTDMGITNLSGMIPDQIFNWNNITSPVTLISLCLGGFLVGFGTRYAGGCTSGHAITGMSQFSLASFVSVCGFFAGGLISTWLLYPFILKLF